MKIHKITLGVALGLLTFGSVVAAYADTNNGSFETGVDTGPAIVVNAGDSTSIDGWTVDSGSVDYVGSYWQAADGSRSIDLRANAVGKISQSVPTVSGQTYKVTFAMAGNPDGENGVKTITVFVDDVNHGDFTFDTTGMTRDAMGWVDKSFQFTATDVTTKLSFMSGTDSVFGPTIDNVRVTEVNAPEPSVTPTNVPTVEPTAVPTTEPTVEPTVEPTAVPTDVPSVEPTTAMPTVVPSMMPKHHEMRHHENLAQKLRAELIKRYFQVGSFCKGLLGFH